jgi:phage head maturation protease
MGLMNEMSFGVQPRKWKDTKEKDGTITREHTESYWYDISPVSQGAFSDTSAQLHDGKPDDRREQMARARARVTQEAYK